MSAARILVIGVAAAGAAIGGYALTRDGDPPADRAQMSDKICLRMDIGYGDELCLSPEEFAARRTQPVRGADGESAVVELTDPADDAATSAAADCANYDRLIGAGWYAATSREMRREAWFRRVCPALAALAVASPAGRSGFAEGAFDADAASQIGEAGLPQGEGLARFGTAAQEAPARWRLAAADGLSAIVEEIAHADFDGDGWGDILFHAAIESGGSLPENLVGVASRPGENAVQRVVWR